MLVLCPESSQGSLTSVTRPVVSEGVVSITKEALVCFTSFCNASRCCVDAIWRASAARHIGVAFVGAGCKGQEEPYSMQPLAPWGRLYVRS